MKVYHVTTFSKLLKYKESGFIKPPVRAWTNLRYAEYMSSRTGRRIILRLKFPDNDIEKLEGHFNQAVVLNEKYKFEGF